MDKETAKDLLKFVNDPWVLNDLHKYMKYRLDVLYKKFEYADSLDEMRKLQGAIEEIKRLKNLREEVRSKAE